MKKQFAKKCFFSLHIMIAIAVSSIMVACNNESEKKDKTKPSIVVNGNATISMPVGETYVDAGAKATDNMDGDISSKINVTIIKGDSSVEKIDTSSAGEFLVKYNVTDAAGNTANEVIKKVIVEKSESGDSKTVYIQVGNATIKDKAGTTGVKIATLAKGTEAKVIGEAKDTGGIVWLNIEFSNNSDKKTGWVKKDSVTDKKENLISKIYKNLDYSPYEKKEFSNNPRVKVKGVYVTVYSAGGKKLDTLIEMTKRTEINAFVIDVKDDDGNLLFPMKVADKYAPKANKKNTVKDISAFMKKMKANKIYTIARIVSFKDPIYTAAHPEKAIIYKSSGKPFTNSDNLRWATAYDRTLWEYNIAVAKEAVAAGFNEVQFDYVRFPASNGGKLDKLLDYRNEKNESKPQAIQEYLKYARKELSPLGVYVSADVYGQVGSVPDDMGLGQYWEAVSNVVDYICPMMYPSHYGNGVYGLSVPDAFPYQTVYKGTKDGLMRNKNIKTPGIIRPWIQDFTAAWVKGHIKYGDAQVAQQIKALKDNGVEEYLLWNAANRYSEGAIRR